MEKARNYEALVALIEKRAGTPFELGKFDCVKWAAAAIHAQLGWRPLAGLKWSNAATALRAIQDEGGLEAGVDRRLSRIAPAHAMRGDIAGVPDPEFGIRLLVIEGSLLVGPGQRGLRREPRSAMAVAWSAVKPARA